MSLFGGEGLPRGWSWVALGDVCEVAGEYGSNMRRVDFDGSVRYVRITDIDDHGKLKESGAVSPSVVEQRYFLQKGDLLFARSGSVGRCYLHQLEKGTYQYAGYLIRYKTLPDVLLPEYMFYITRSYYWRQWIKTQSKTATLANINAKQFSSFALPLPPLAEQRRIVAGLNRRFAAVETARAAALERVDAARALPAAWLREVFAFDGESLPRGWRWEKLGDTCEINPRRPKEFDRADDKPTTFIPMDAVNATYGVVDKPRVRPYGEIKKGYTFFSDGDVLFAKITPCMQNGKHFIAGGLLDGFGFASTEFHVLRPGKSLLAEWAHFYLRQPAILKEATYHFTGTVGQQRVPDSFLKKLSIPLPPLAQQKRLVASLNAKMASAEKARAAAEAELDAITALPAALLREAFSGAL